MPRTDKPKWYRIHESDLLKLYDALNRNTQFHRHRDEMNAQLHLAEQTRYSPLTSETEAARDRALQLLQEAAAEGRDDG